MTISLLTLLRVGVVLLGGVAATLLVQALDRGLSGEPRPLVGTHAAFGAVLAITVMPGTILGFFVGPSSGERARGLAVGGSGVTAFAALLGGAFSYRRVAEGGVSIVEGLTLAWAVLALVLAATDYFRLRVGAKGV